MVEKYLLMHGAPRSTRLEDMKNVQKNVPLNMISP